MTRIRDDGTGPAHRARHPRIHRAWHHHGDRPASPGRGVPAGLAAATGRWEASIAAGSHDDTQTAWPYVPPAMLTADCPTMTAFLDRIRQTHGTGHDLAAALGITGSTLGRLRDTLLT